MKGIGITPAELEKRMLKHEQVFNKMYVETECKAIITDVAAVLKQEGYTAGANVLERMFKEYE